MSGGACAVGRVGAGDAEGAGSARGGAKGEMSPSIVVFSAVATGGSAAFGPGSRRLHATNTKPTPAIERALHTVVRD